MRPFGLLTAGLLSIVLIIGSCKNEPKAPATPAASMLPAGTIPPTVQFSDVHCWVENGQFFVIGICENNSSDWQKIWLQMAPTDAQGQQIQVNGQQNAVFPVLSDAVPPRGRSSFFTGWPLSAFGNNTPDSCRLTGAGALVTPAGPILIAEQQSGVRMLGNPRSDDPTLPSERAWQISMVLNNALPQPANHPRIELLLYGQDKRLWMSFLVNPEDAAQKAAIQLTEEHSGPLAPQEKRRYAWYVAYGGLPQALRQQTIGRVEMLAFEAGK